MLDEITRNSAQHGALLQLQPSCPHEETQPLYTEPEPCTTNCDPVRAIVRCMCRAHGSLDQRNLCTRRT